MAIDGKYEIEINSPMGTMNETLTLKTDGDNLSGIVSGGPMGDHEFSGGTVSGDALAWEIAASSPMGEMTLEFTAKVTGDEITGQVKVGSFGTSDFKGKRV